MAARRDKPRPEDRVNPLQYVKYTNKFLTKHRAITESTTNAAEVEAVEGALPFLMADCFQWEKRTNQATILQVQNALMDIWQKLLDNVDHIYYTNRELYFDVIYRTMVRYEFDLVHYFGRVPTTSSHSPSSDSEGKESFLPQLVCTAEQEAMLFRYKELLLKTITYVLRKVEDRQFNTFIQKKFALQVFAVAYTRIPVLAGALLEAICPQWDSPPPEVLQESPVSRESIAEQHRGTLKGVANQRVSESAGGDGKEALQPIPPEQVEKAMERVTGLLKQQRDESLNREEEAKRFFDWNPGLFQWTWLASPEKDAELIERLTRIRARFQDPAEDFNFLFVSAFVAYVVNQTHGQVMWALVPGFANMLESVVSGAVKKHICEYGVWTEKCLTELTRVQGAFTIVVDIVISSTRITNKEEVGVLLNTLDNFFFRGCTPEDLLSSIFPEDFDTSLLLTAIDMLLDNDHFQILSKTLWFLYRNLSRFRLDDRKKLLDLLVHKYFGKLFLHWCTEVRTFFHFLILFRIDRVGQLRDARKDINASDLHHEYKRDMLSMAVNTGKGVLGRLMNLTESKSESKVPRRMRAKRGPHVENEVCAFGSEPTASTCIILTNNLTEEDILQDEIAVTTIGTFLMMIEEQAGTDETKQNGAGTGGDSKEAPLSFPAELTAYAVLSLKEYSDIKKLFHKIQTEFPPSALRAGQVMIPHFLYEIKPHVGGG